MIRRLVIFNTLLSLIRISLRIIICSGRRWWRPSPSSASCCFDTPLSYCFTVLSLKQQDSASCYFNKLLSLIRISLRIIIVAAGDGSGPRSVRRRARLPHAHPRSRPGVERERERANFAPGFGWARPEPGPDMWLCRCARTHTYRTQCVGSDGVSQTVPNWSNGQTYRRF